MTDLSQQDPQTADVDNVSNYYYGLDTHSAVADQRSIFDTASDVVTKAVPLTGLDIVNSFANTGIELANVFGAGADKWSIENEVGQGSDLANYYSDHKQGIDAASLLVGSLIPGLAGVKAFKYGTAALRAASGLAEDGEATGILARATGLLPSVQKEKIIADAAQQINEPTGLFNTLTSEKTKAIALGFGDQFLQSLSYEVATAATMKANPLLDQYNFNDMLGNIFQGAVLGAGIGGVIEGIGTRAIFNKMIQGADDTSKAQQIYSKLGMGDYEAGDVVNTIIHSVWNTPAATTKLGGLYQKLTGDAAGLAAKKALGELVPSGDEELTNGLYDVVTRMKNSGSISEDDAYNTFANLAKVQRITNPIAPDVDDGSFFINKRASKTGPSGVDWSSMVSKTPTPLSDLNLKFQLKSGSFDVKTAKASDTFFDVNGNPAPQWKNSDEAFNGGNDIWINTKGDIIVNPNAPNIEQIAKTGESRVLSQKEEIQFRKEGTLPDGSKPLYGSQATNQAKPGATIINTKTGSVTDTAIPTVGDWGGLDYTLKGLKYGDGEFSEQSIGSEITSKTPTIDASARYAWFSARGIKSGDSISSTDIPALETLYRGLGDGSLKDSLLEKVNIDGEDVPDASDVLSMIKNAKNEQITEDVKSGMSSEEAALRANVPEQYIASAFKSPDFMNPADYHSTLTHAQLWYNIGNLNTGLDGNLLKGIRDTQYRVKLIKTANQDAAAAHFGEGYENYIIDGTADQAGLTKAPGPGFWSFSSAAYNSFGQQFERVGRFLSGKNQADIAVANRALVAPANALRTDPTAAAEAGLFRAARWRTGESYSWLPQDLEAKYMGDSNTGNVAVLTKALVKDDTGKIIDFNPAYIPDGFVDATKQGFDQQTTGLRNVYSLSPKVAAWERANQELNDARVVSRNNFYAANGITRSLPTGTLYTPPIDTSKFPFVAYLKSRPGTGMADDSVGVITAQSQQELQAKVAQLGDQYSVFYKGGETSLKTLHEVEGDYQYDRNFSQNRVQSDLARKGILNDVLPSTDGQKIVQDYVDWHARQITGLNRDFTELGNGQLFAELRSMGDRFSASGTSKSGYIPPILQRETPNPYQSYINTALNISPKDQYRLWSQTNDVAESMFSTAFDALKSGFQSARAGLVPYEKASDLAQSFGLGKIYETASDPIKAYYGIANKSPQGKELSKFVAAANTILGTGIIRLDGYQSLIHAITTPMLTVVEAASVRSQALKSALSTTLPGTQTTIPATSKLLFNAVRNFWNRDQILSDYPWYHDLGSDKTVLGAHAEMMNQLGLPRNLLGDTDFAGKLAKAADLGATISGSNFTNTFNHFISTDVGRQIFEAQGFEGKALQDQVMTFTNRVQGNYIAGQRPVAFQGPVGQAFGLFQTFGLNMLQNLFRYVENGEGKTLGLLSGLQTSLFGLQGMPGFNFINTHLVGNAMGNSSHDDIYSGIASAVGAGRGSLGDYLLYGTTSNWLDANLYNRGDISPRNISVFPTNPLDVPIIKGSINIVKNLVDTEQRIRNGAPVGPSLLLAMEHNGLNRPLSGLAQLAQGFSTNEDGQVIGTTQGTNGQSELFSMANFSRLMGARPLDEAVALGTLGRYGVYSAKDEARIQELGKAAKVELYKNGDLAPDEVSDLATRYAAIGGSINKFNSTISRWTSQANGATANKVFQSLRNPGAAQNAMMEMGGLQLPDYRNNSNIIAAGDQGGQ